MNDDKAILACVDQSKSAESLTDFATGKAKGMQPPMELLCCPRCLRHWAVAHSPQAEGTRCFEGHSCGPLITQRVELSTRRSLHILEPMWRQLLRRVVQQRVARL